VLVDRHVGRDDAEDLRHVGGDELLLERVRAVEEALACADGDYDAAARFGDDANAIAAGQRRRPTLQDAFERVPGVEDYRRLRRASAARARLRTRRIIMASGPFCVSFKCTSG
jgi:hypothetical protein